MMGLELGWDGMGWDGMGWSFFFFSFFFHSLRTDDDGRGSREGGVMVWVIHSFQKRCIGFRFLHFSHSCFSHLV